MPGKYRFGAVFTEGGPAIILKAEDFLFPQYDRGIRDFVLASKAWLEMTASQLLEDGRGAPRVRRRWEEIVDGTFFCVVELPWEG